MKSYLSSYEMAQMLGKTKKRFLKDMNLFIKDYSIDKEILKSAPNEYGKEEGYKIPRISSEFLALMLTKYNKNPFFNTKKAQNKVKFSEISGFYDDLIKGSGKLSPYIRDKTLADRVMLTRKMAKCLESFMDKFCILLHLYFRNQQSLPELFNIFDSINSDLDKYINASIRKNCFVSVDNKGLNNFNLEENGEEVTETVCLDYELVNRFLYFLLQEKQSSLYKKYENEDNSSESNNGTSTNDYLMEYIKEIVSHCDDEDIARAYLEHYSTEIESPQPQSFDELNVLYEGDYLKGSCNDNPASKKDTDEWFDDIGEYILKMLSSNLLYEPDTGYDEELLFLGVKDYNKNFVKKKYLKHYVELIKMNKITKEDAKELILEDLKETMLRERNALNNVIHNSDNSISKVREYLDLGFGQLFLDNFRKNPYIREKGFSSD